MARYNLSRNDSLARSPRPIQTLDQQFKAQGLELKAQFEQGKISRRDYLAGLAILVAEYREKAGK